jgi:amino acid transporter
MTEPAVSETLVVAMSEPATTREGRPERKLGLLDSTSLIVGIIVGAGIYQVAPDVARGTGGAWGVLALWVAGGAISLFGAFAYAELGAALPRAGGDYVYLTRAYGPWAGFLFGWMQTIVVRPGDIAGMAFAFATYAQVVWDPWPGSAWPSGGQLYACLAVLVLTGINLIGVREGTWTQNLLTAAKVGGLLLVLGLAVAVPPGRLPEAEFDSLPARVALILVLFTYGGWNEMAYVAAEVRQPRRNIARALILGTVSVTVLYLLANGAFLHTLGYTGLATSEAVAADSVSQALPTIGGALVAGLVCLSALGAVNGLIFTGARISYAMGREHRAFRPLGRWSGRTGTPIPALLVQGGIAIALILTLGSFLNAIVYTAAAVYLFYAATSISVLVLRRREPELDRPFRVPLYPWTTLVFCAICIVLVHGAIVYKPQISALALLFVAAGLPIYAWSRRRKPPPPAV